MKKDHLVILSMMLATAFVGIAAYGEPASSLPTLEGPDVAAIAKGLASWSLWWTLLASVVAGALGGVVYELLILQGNIEFPHKPQDSEVTDKTLFAIPKYMYDLGVWARVVIGGLAAVAGVWVLAPATTFSALATALVAGSAGTSIFRSVQDRLLSALAQKETVDTKAKAKIQGEKVEEAMRELIALKTVSGLQQGKESSLERIPSGVTIDPEALERLGTLLSEAKGAGATIK